MSSVADLNATQGSLLGFLHDGPLTGWDLIRRVEGGLSRFWNVTSSHVYRELRTLEERGLTSSELALVGFSQGTMISLFVGLRRAMIEDRGKNAVAFLPNRIRRESFRAKAHSPQIIYGPHRQPCPRLLTLRVCWLAGRSF